MGDEIVSSAVKRRLGAVLFADIVDYSRLMGADEIGTRTGVSRRVTIIENIAPDFSGQIIQIMGDGIFMLFESAVDAVSFAVKVQRRMDDENRDEPEQKKMRFRFGINLGEIIYDERGITGDSVNVAARIETFARPGCVCISGSVYDQVRNKLTFGYEYLGEQNLKNITDPVDVFQVHEEAASATMTTGRRRSSILSPPHMDGFNNLSIVILPFKFQGTEQSESWFADGLTEDITTCLSRFHNFSVISRASAFVYLDKNVTPGMAARELGVRYVVNGSVRKAGSRIRVTIQLQDAENDRLIWGDQYNRVVDDIFDLQDEVTQIIVAATAVQIETSERDRIRQLAPSDLLAYDYVLQGQQHIFRYTKPEIRFARSLYDAALDTDPHYARAMAAKSRTLNLDWRYDWVDSQENALDTALDLALKAIEIDGSDARAYGELGFSHLYRKEHDASITAYTRALSLNPNDADLMSDMADALSHAGESEEAISLLKKAMRLNPFYPDQYLWHLAGAYYNVFRYEDAIQTVLSMQNPTEGRRILAASYAQLGRMDEARATADLVLKAHPNFNVEKWAAVQPDRVSEEHERFREGLKKAGL